MNRRKIVCLDLDQTLISFIPSFLKVNNVFFGVEITEDEYSEHWGETRWKSRYSDEEWEKKNGREWAKHVVEIGLYRDLPAMPGAKEALMKLAGLEARLMVLTSRRIEFMEDTKFCLAKLFPEIEFERLFVTGAYDGHEVSSARHAITKGAMAAELGVSVLVDDQPKHALSAVECGVSAILFGRDAEAMGVDADEKRGLYRAMDWSEATSILERILMT